MAEKMTFNSIDEAQDYYSDLTADVIDEMIKDGRIAIKPSVADLEARLRAESEATKDSTLRGFIEQDQAAQQKAVAADLEARLRAESEATKDSTLRGAIEQDQKAQQKATAAADLEARLRAESEATKDSTLRGFIEQDQKAQQKATATDLEARLRAESEATKDSTLRGFIEQDQAAQQKATATDLEARLRAESEAAKDSTLRGFIEQDQKAQQKAETVAAQEAAIAESEEIIRKLDPTLNEDTVKKLAKERVEVGDNKEAFDKAIEEAGKQNAQTQERKAAEQEQIANGQDGIAADAGETANNKPAGDVEINEWTSKADEYKEKHYLQNDYDHGHGDGSKDIGDVGDQDKATVDIVSPYADKLKEFGEDGIIHKGEGISHHHHQTMPDYYEVDGKKITYLPGQIVELAKDNKLSKVERFDTMYHENLKNNILGENSTLRADGKLSRIEYIAAFASSGKYSAQDLSLTADKLAEKYGADTFEVYKGPYFEGTKIAQWARDNKDKKYSEYEKELEDDVADLEKGWKEIHGMLETMSGEAKDAESLYTVQCVQGKFEVTFGNINERLKPACLAISYLLYTTDKSQITGLDGVKLPPLPEVTLKVDGIPAGAPLTQQLELGEKALNNLLGTGENPATPNEKKLLEEDIPNAEQALKTAKTIRSAISIPVPATYIKDDGTEGNNSGQIENAKKKYNEADAKVKECEKALEDLKKELEDLEKQIDELRTGLNTIMEYSVILFNLIDNYDKERKTYRSYVRPGKDGKNSEIYDWVTSKNIEVLKANHDAIIHGFEDYDKMPVITNKSDYQNGDVVLYDDAHGFIYFVKGYDPLTGELIIACRDKDGHQIGSDIVVMDQREITPRQKIFEDEYPISDTKPEKDPNKDPKTTKPKTNPTTPKPTTPKPTTPVPSTTTPPTPTNPPEEPTIPPDITPTIPIYTTPPIPGPTAPPNGPHTGLDAIYGSGDTKQSATGLGALAGLAAGAAGLGLTGLLGDKEKEDEEEEDSTLQTTEENKPLEHEGKEDNQDKVPEEDFSDPQFF